MGKLRLLFLKLAINIKNKMRVDRGKAKGKRKKEKGDRNCRSRVKLFIYSTESDFLFIAIFDLINYTIFLLYLNRYLFNFNMSITPTFRLGNDVKWILLRRSRRFKQFI